jgi:hypothetical protein
MVIYFEFIANFGDFKVLFATDTTLDCHELNISTEVVTNFDSL